MFTIYVCFVFFAPQVQDCRNMVVVFVWDFSAGGGACFFLIAHYAKTRYLSASQKWFQTESSPKFRWFLPKNKWLKSTI